MKSYGDLLKRVERGEPLSAEQQRLLAEIALRDSVPAWGEHDQIGQASDAPKTNLEGFWARIKCFILLEEHRWRWWYGFEQVTKELNEDGYDHWEKQEEGINACGYNIIEDQNTGSGIEGTGVDLDIWNAEVRGGPFELAPCPVDTVVWMHKVGFGHSGKGEAITEYWFQYENHVNPTTTTTTTTTAAPSGSGSTTTSDNPISQTPDQTCTGQCKWIWSAESATWGLDGSDTDFCVNITTTSTSTSTSTTAGGSSTTSTTTSTTPGCFCTTTTTSTSTSTTAGGGPTTTTTSTTTTAPPTTTTAGNCVCAPPTFCGTDDGECNYTNCFPTVNQAPQCTPAPIYTTTTTASPTTPTPLNCALSDCVYQCRAGDTQWEWVQVADNCYAQHSSWCMCPGAGSIATVCHSATQGDYENVPCQSICASTTDAPTTTTKNVCVLGCNWVWMPRSNLSGWYWEIDPSSSDCYHGWYTGCPCPAPASDGTGPCSIAHTDCVTTTTTSTTTTINPYCTNYCWWLCKPSLNNIWVRIRFGCVYNDVVGCDCYPPSAGCSECAIYKTPCVTITTTTTTTLDPCAVTTIPPVTSSTTSTSTTENCESQCKWSWDEVGQSWSQIENNCPGSCPCYEPERAGYADCEKAETPCHFGPTTTTTAGPTTTTTTTAAPTTTTTPDGPTTTTAAPTTTTTTTAAPTTTSTSTSTSTTCDWQAECAERCGVGYCVYQCFYGSSWVMIDDDRCINNVIEDPECCGGDSCQCQDPASACVECTEANQYSYCWVDCLPQVLR